MMALESNNPSPRRFSYTPRVYKGEKPERISFKRITRYDPHIHARRPVLMTALLVMALALVYLLGGVRPRIKALQLTMADVVQLPIQSRK